MDTDELLPVAPGAQGASALRRYVAERLTGLSDDVVGDAQLVLTELVTNAQLHGMPPVHVRVRRRGEAARVEVHDASPRRLVLPVQSPDAMTGRGLALVAALSAAWGVDAAPEGGKAVWAELAPGGDERPGAPALDPDALLSAWGEEPDEREHTVRLGAVPTVLLLEAKRHVDNVVRELTLERAGADTPLPPEVERLVETVTRSFSRARAGVKEQAAAAAARGDRQTELVLRLPVSSVEAGERYLEALDEVDRYARQARLLTLETPPLHRLFRRWYVTALVEQLRARAQGREPDEPVPFVEVLLAEVDELARLREAAGRLDLLQRLHAELVGAHTAEAMARLVVAAAVHELGAVTARVHLEQDGVLRAHGQSAAPHAGAPRYDEMPVDADLPVPLVFRTGRSLVLRTVAQAAERFPVLGDVFRSERALHVVPLEVGRHRLGVLALAFPPSSRYDERAQTAYVRALADALAQGLERIDVSDRLARLGEQTSATSAPATHARDGAAQVWVGGSGEQRLKSLADAAGAIAGADSVDALLQVVSEAARTVVGTHQSVATRLYGGTWEHASTHVSLSDEYEQWRSYDVVPQGKGVLNWVTRENKPLRLTAEQLQAHPEYRGLRDAPGHPPLPDYMAAPLISRDGHNIGLVQLSHKLDGSVFDEADEAAAVQLALMVSAALEHVETASDLERALERLRGEREVVDALHEVGRAVTSRLERAEVVRLVTDAATVMTRAEVGAFCSPGSAGSHVLDAVCGPQTDVPADVVRQALAGEGLVRLHDVGADGVARGWLAVPVRLSDGEVGGALVFGAQDPGVLDDDAARLALGLAGYASIALENGRLYDAARRESLAKEEVAAALEQPLQPPELPVVPGVQLAAVFQPLGDGRLGGDFYDVFPLGGDRWMLALGDVAGKGPEAAALTGLVRHTLWGAAQYAPDPVAVARAVNGALLRQHSDRFATLVLAVLTRVEHGVQVEAVWAGHPAALLVRDSDVELVSGEGMPVGLFPELGLQPVRFTVGPGETLVLYTDGLLERQGRVLEECEFVELVRSRAEHPLDEALPALAGDVARLAPPRDDVAAVALRVARQP